MVLDNNREQQPWIYGRFQSLPYIFLTLCFLIFSCSEKKEEVEKESPTYSVLILKNFNPINQMDFSDDSTQDKENINNGNKKISIRRPLSISNNKTPVIIINPKKLLPIEEINLFNNISDTIRIFHSNDIMMSEVNFTPLTSNIYYFRAGDTIIVDSKDNKVKEFYTNKNVKKGDLIPAYTKDIFSSPISLILNPNLINKDSVYFSKQDRKNDSLFRIGEVYEPFYEIMKAQSTFRYPEKIKKIEDGFTLDIGNESLYKELIKQDKFIYLNNYQAFLSSYANKKYEIKIVSIGNGVTSDNKTLFDSVYISDIFGKNAKDYLLYSSLNAIYEDYPEKVYLEYTEKFKKVVSDTTLITVLQKKKLIDFKEVTVNTKEVQLIDLKENVTTLSAILEKHKGKVVYVDYWTSWCAPCIDALPKSKKLQKEYKNKDVVFVYINNEKEKDKWEIASKQYNLISSENYYTLNFPKAKFYQDLEFKSVPRYLLFDKKGKLIQSKAPAPNSDIIREILNQLLK